MKTPTIVAPARASLAETRELPNLARELCDYNMFSEDAALCEAVRREGAQAAEPALLTFGQLTGSASYRELGDLANRFPPVLQTHDRFGRGVDRVSYHPVNHQLMRSAIEHGLHASPWTAPGTGAHVARGAHGALDAWLAALSGELKDLRAAEYRSRALVERMALALQASLLLRPAPSFIGDAFCRSRLTASGPRHYGTLPTRVDVAATTRRATPRCAIH